MLKLELPENSFSGLGWEAQLFEPVPEASVQSQFANILKEFREVWNLEPCWCPWSMLPQDTMMTSMIKAATGDHADVCDLGCHQRPCPYLWLMLKLLAMLISKVHTVAGSHEKVYDPCCHLGPYLRSIFWAASRGCVDVHGPQSYRKWCGSPQSVLLMAVVGGKASFGRGIDGSRSKVENERPWRTLQQPPCPKRKKQSR